MSEILCSIRAMRPEDIERIHEIYRAAHLDEYAGEEKNFSQRPISDSPALKELFTRCQFYVYDDSEAKGFVGHQDEKIIWLYVHPDHRGQKIGLQLIDFLLARLKGSITISVVKSNKPALNLYMRKGFKVFGDFVFDYQGIPIEVYKMRLGPPP